jgi:hypothetical protein
MIDVSTRHGMFGVTRWRDRTRAMGALLMAVAAAAAWMARDLPIVHWGTVGPGAFPLLLTTVLAVAGLVLALRSRTPPVAAQVRSPSAPWMPLAGMALFALTLPWLGTLLALSLCGMVIARSTSGYWGRACLIGPGLAVLLHGVVMWGLATPLPWWLP